MSKKDVLVTLKSTDGYVSGQELCEKLHVSRTAVWKWIKQLKEEGYEIDAVSNKGYRILSSPDLMTAEEVEGCMETSWIARDVRYFASIDSTNQYAKQLGEAGEPEGVLVIADEQTSGKGRRGRSWATPAGSNIAMTLLLRPKISLDRISMLTLVAGMAITQAARDLYDLDAAIKWPNDVVIGGRKLCGILTEMSSEMLDVHYVVVGIGINVNQKTFPEELTNTATSLSLEVKREVNRAEMIAQCMKRFEEYYELFLQNGDLSLLQETYNSLLVNQGRTVKVLEPGNEYTGTAEGINERGELLVRLENGELRSVYAGEVSVRGVYGYV